jgi:predicted AlkP superfamily pyrophosphatase or phosphodiesterase
MKKIYLLALILISVYSHAQEIRNEKHVVLISIDGFRPEFYLDTLWYAPTLHRLVRQGVCAESVKPVYPSVTYPNHISMITGMLPNKHGIYYNRPASGKVKTWNTSMIKTPTIFDAVNQAGLSSSALFWPVMAESSIQYNVPLSRNVKGSSSDFMNQIASPGLWKELEKNAIGKVSVNEIRNDKNTGKMAAYIVQTYKPALTAVHFIGLDHAQHKVGIKNQTVADALLVIDKAIEQIILAIDVAGMTPTTTLLIVGDHGFCDVHSSLSPNVWLKKKNVFKNSTRWKARYYTTNGAAFLYLKDQNDERTLRKVKRLLDNLPDHEKNLFRIIERDELQKIGADPDAMLALNPLPGIVFRQTGSGKLVKQATGGAHGYLADFPDIMTGFIGWGNGLNPGTVIQQMNMPDIAPIITRLLEIDFNSEDGVVNEDMFIKY